MITFLETFDGEYINVSTITKIHPGEAGWTWIETSDKKTHRVGLGGFDAVKKLLSTDCFFIPHPRPGVKA